MSLSELYPYNFNLIFILVVIFTLFITVLIVIIFFKKRRKQDQLELFNINDLPESIKVIAEQFNARLNEYKTKTQHAYSQLTKLNELRHEDNPPIVVLSGASQDELSSIISMFPEELYSSSTCQEIVEVVCKAGSHKFASTIRGLGQGDKYVSYFEVVKDVAGKVGVKYNKRMSLYDLEKNIICKVFESILTNCTPEEKATLIKGLDRQHEKNFLAPSVAAGTLIVANLSGISLYLASTANMIAIATAFGIAVPAYAGVISILSVATGPIGWGALAIAFAYKLGGPDFKKTVPSVMMISSVRSRQIAERDIEIQTINELLSGELAKEKTDLEALRLHIFKLRH